MRRKGKDDLEAMHYRIVNYCKKVNGWFSAAKVESKLTVWVGRP